MNFALLPAVDSSELHALAVVDDTGSSSTDADPCQLSSTVNPIAYSSASSASSAACASSSAFFRAASFNAVCFFTSLELYRSWIVCDY